MNTLENSIYKELEDKGSIFYGWATAMHTRIDMILCHRDKNTSENAAIAAVEELKRLEKRLNRFDPFSDITRINALADQEPVKLDDEMWNILTLATEYGAKTNYLFDITAGSPNQDTPPHNRIWLDPDKRVILFKVKGVEIDLGGFAKGYGVEMIRNKLLAEGWTDFLINFGNSTICAQGTRPGGDGWSVGVENLESPGSNILEVVLRNQSLNTSGNTAEHSRHIFSKGIGPIDGIGSVSIVSNHPLDGEILSTAVFGACHQENSSLAFARKFSGIRAYAIKYTGKGHSLQILL